VSHAWSSCRCRPSFVRTVEDTYIAATAKRHGLTIATGNDRDFKRPGLKVFNPFKDLPDA
jgi:predicted nucleic acid-binding protein